MTFSTMFLHEFIVVFCHQGEEWSLCTYLLNTPAASLQLSRFLLADNFPGPDPHWPELELDQLDSAGPVSAPHTGPC